MGLPIKNMKGNDSKEEPLKLPNDRPHNPMFVSGDRVRNLDHGISPEETRKIEAFEDKALNGSLGSWPSEEACEKFNESLTLKERPWPERQDPKLPFKEKKG